MNKHDNTIAKKEPVRRNKGQDDAPSTSRTTTASKLSRIERAVISIKNKIGVNISTEESQRIINSIPAEKGLEDTPKSLIKALNRKKDKHPELNIDEKKDLAHAKKGERILNEGIEEQKGKLNDEKEAYMNYSNRRQALVNGISRKLAKNSWEAFRTLQWELVKKFGHEHRLRGSIYQYKKELEEEMNALQDAINKRQETDSQALRVAEENIRKKIYNTTKKIKKENDTLVHRKLNENMLIIKMAEEFERRGFVSNCRKDIEKYHALRSEYLSLPSIIKAREQGIVRLEEYRETTVMTVENCEHILLIKEVRDVMALANEVLKNESEKYDEQLNEINRDMKDIQIKQDMINTLIANHNGQNKKVDTEEKDIIFPSVPQHEPEPNSNIVLEDTLRHKTKSNKKTAVLE